MPTVLVTRPVEDSEQLALRLARLGYQCRIEPLLKIEPAQDAPPSLNGLQAVMLSSAHAIGFLDKLVIERAGLLKLPCFCVGSRTALAARAFGFGAVHDAAGDGAALAQLIEKHCDPNKAALLHLCGRDTDGQTRSQLERHGFTVKAWITYKAEAAETLSADLVDALRQTQLDVILVFSARTAATLKQLLAKNSLKACCGSVIALGISKAVCAALDDLPWRTLEAAASPTEDAVLAALQKLSPVSGVP